MFIKDRTNLDVWIAKTEARGFLAVESWPQIKFTDWAFPLIRIIQVKILDLKI
jgi:hypothetical protein